MVQAPSTIDLLFEQASLLDPEQRALLAHWLIDSIVDDSIEKEPGYDEYWEAKLTDDLNKLREGRTKLIPLEEAWPIIFGTPLDAPHPQ